MVYYSRGNCYKLVKMFVTNEKLLQRLDKPAVTAKLKRLEKVQIGELDFSDNCSKQNILGGN